MTGVAPDPYAYLERLLRAPDDQVSQMLADRDRVLAEYGRLFHPDNLHRLTAEDFKAFLLYDNNRHWWGIHRHQAKLVSNMARLREVLGHLLNEAEPIVKRLDRIEPTQGLKPIPGLGKAVFTPVMHVVYPELYGVWNSIVESAITRLGLWPRFSWGASFGNQYLAVNHVIHKTAGRLGVDLWTMDALWWRVEKDHNRPFFAGSLPSSTQSASSLPERLKGKAPTFVCQICFQSKPTSLQAPGTTTCVDCRGDI